MFSPLRPIYPVAGIREIEDKLIPNARPPLMERAGRAAAQDAVRLIMDRPGPILVACGPRQQRWRRLRDGAPAHSGRARGRGRLLQHGRAAAGRGPRRRTPTTSPPAAASSPTCLPPRPTAGPWWSTRSSASASAARSRGATRAGSRPSTPNPARAWLSTSRAGSTPDTGTPLGATFRATHTTTFIALKPGLLTNDGPDHCGEISVQRIEIDAAAWLPARGHAIAPSLFRHLLQPRPRNTHKGLYGDAAILGGNAGMVGAALLAGRSALWLGTGRVYVGLLDPAGPAVDFAHPELMLRRAETLPERLSALAIGPGLGTEHDAAALLAVTLARPVPLLLDADALNLVALQSSLREAVRTRAAATVLTPHPAEAARLLGTDTASVQGRSPACRARARPQLSRAGGAQGLRQHRRDP
jgi:hypothetical protein